MCKILARETPSGKFSNVLNFPRTRPIATITKLSKDYF